MKSFILCFFTLALLANIAVAQRAEFPAWNDSTYKKADAAAGVVNLTQEEKDVIYFINLARMNGKLFVETYLDKYIKDNHLDYDNSYIRSLIKALKSQKPMPPLEYKAGLCETAKTHAEDLGKTGKTGHVSSNGKKFDERIRAKIKNKTTLVGENCSYGIKGGLEIVCDLLIDEGISTVGHRDNILNKEYVYVGVGVAAHKKYRTNCVQDFAGKL